MSLFFTLGHGRVASLDSKPVLLHPVFNRIRIYCQFGRVYAIASIIRVMLLTVGDSTRAFQNYKSICK